MRRLAFHALIFIIVLPMYFLWARIGLHFGLERSVLFSLVISALFIISKIIFEYLKYKLINNNKTNT